MWSMIMKDDGLNVPSEHTIHACYRCSHLRLKAFNKATAKVMVVVVVVSLESEKWEADGGEQWWCAERAGWAHNPFMHAAMVISCE